MISKVNCISDCDICHVDPRDFLIEGEGSFPGHSVVKRDESYDCKTELKNEIEFQKSIKHWLKYRKTLKRDERKEIKDDISVLRSRNKYNKDQVKQIKDEIKAMKADGSYVKNKNSYVEMDNFFNLFLDAMSNKLIHENVLQKLELKMKKISSIIDYVEVLKNQALDVASRAKWLEIIEYYQKNLNELNAQKAEIKEYINERQTTAADLQQNIQDILDQMSENERESEQFRREKKLFKMYIDTNKKLIKACKEMLNKDELKQLKGFLAKVKYCIKANKISLKLIID